MKMLAIDIGASGGKAIVGELSGNKLSLSEIRRFPNGIVEINSRKKWGFQNILREIIECLRISPDVESVGVDTWGVDYGYIDAAGNLVDEPFAYRDNRTDAVINKVHEKISFEELYKITGIQFMRINTIYQLADDVFNHTERLKKADKFLMMPDLIRFFLTGDITSEYTIASTSGLIDVQNTAWSDEILYKLGFPKDMFPPVVYPGLTKTRLSAEISDATGCKADLVTVAGHDTACAVASVPASGDNWAYISSGTWSLIGIELREPCVTDAAMKANFTNEGGVSGRIRFLKNVTGLWLIEEMRRAWEKEGLTPDYKTIIEEARQVPHFRSFIDPDHRSFLAPDDMKVAIQEYCRNTQQEVPQTVGEFSRCIFESLALAYRQVIEQLMNITGREIEKIHVVGGGAKNGFLNQMIADACGVLVYAGPFEAAATGNILVQAIANGLIADIDEGRSVIADSITPLEYIPAENPRWHEASEKFTEIKKSSF